MNRLLKPEMIEATRLTREGKLQEAMAILQGKGQGGRAPDAGAATAAKSLELSPSAADGAWTFPAAESTLSPEAGSAPKMPKVLRELLGRVAKPGARLRRGLSPAAGKGRLAEQPEGARFESRCYTNAAGSRDYKLYVPSGYRGESVPLIVMLHGCTQSPDDFAAGTRMNEIAEEETFIVAYPAQSQAANASKCWNWFNAAEQVRDRGEPSLIAGMTREIMRDFAVAPDRVFVAGLSAGGAAAAIMGSTYRDLYAAIGVHSGLACGAARDMPSAFAAMKQGGGMPPRRPSASPPLRTIVIHGDRDTTVHAVNGDEVIAQSGPATGLRRTVTEGTSAGGVAYTRAVQSDANGRPVLEQWTLHGAGHAWSGGSTAGSFTDPRGPDASRAMVRFFLG